MSNERIIEINSSTPILRLRNTNDVMELDNSGLPNSTASAQISVSNITGGVLMDYSSSPVTITTAMLASGFASVYKIPFNSTLATAPTKIDITLMCNSLVLSNLTTVFGNIVYNLTDTQYFYVALSAPVPDGTHKITWRAYV